MIKKIVPFIQKNLSLIIFGYQPCILCLHQRKPFFIIIILSLISLTVLKEKKHKDYIFFISIMLLLINSIIAFYHVGVEQHFFAGPATCSSKDLNDFTNLEDLMSAISKVKAVKCDEPEFFLFGLSMAAWNLIYCLFLSTFLALIKFSNSEFKEIKAAKKEQNIKEKSKVKKAKKKKQIK
jgi:disulfide bond formation protein DsbB